MDALESAAAPSRSNSTNLTGERILGNVVVVAMNIVLFLFALTAIFPPIWMMYNSLKSSDEFSHSILALPRQPSLYNYAEIFGTAKVYIALANSLFNAVVSTAGIIVLAFVIGYFLARYQFRGRGLVYGFFLFGLLVPIYGLMVPVFIQFKSIGMLNNHFTLLGPYIAFGLSQAIFLIEGYIHSVPPEIEEAAYVDGASVPDLLLRVVFPICRPIIATAALLAFLATWNEFAFALILLSDDALKTIPLWLNTFQGERTVNYTGLMAALTVASIPVIVIYLFFREKIIQGFVAGALKG